MIRSVESGYGFIPIYPSNSAEPEPSCSRCHEELTLHEQDFSREDDEQMCVACLRELAIGRALLAKAAMQVGDLCRADRAYEDAWVYVGMIEAAEKRERVWISARRQPIGEAK